MKLALQIVVVVVAAYVASALVAWSSLPTPRLDEAELREREAKLEPVLRTSVPSLRECGLVVPYGTAVVITASHRRLVRVARCLERADLITIRELRAIERDKKLSLGGTVQISEVESRWDWRVGTIWFVAVGAIGFLLYRHWKRTRQSV